MSFNSLQSNYGGLYQKTPVKKTKDKENLDQIKPLEKNVKAGISGVRGFLTKRLNVSVNGLLSIGTPLFVLLVMYLISRR